MLENPIAFFIGIVIIALVVFVFVHLFLAALDVFLILVNFLLRFLSIPFTIRDALRR